MYNDYNHNLTNLFRVMIFRPNAFKIELGFCHLNARDFFEEWKHRIDTEDFHNPYFEEELRLTEVLYDIDVAKAVLEIQKRIENDCDLHRAATFLKLIRHSYASSCKSFASQPFDITKLYDGIEQLAVRMNNAVVENQDFETLIKHYDREDSFFYCDPPYYDSEYVYKGGFAKDNHQRLHDVLVNVKGKWLLSYNDCPEIRELYDVLKHWKAAAEKGDPHALQLLKSYSKGRGASVAMCSMSLLHHLSRIIQTRIEQNRRGRKVKTDRKTRQKTDDKKFGLGLH